MTEVDVFSHYFNPPLLHLGYLSVCVGLQSLLSRIQGIVVYSNQNVFPINRPVKGKYIRIGEYYWDTPRQRYSNIRHENEPTPLGASPKVLLAISSVNRYSLAKIAD